MFRQLIAVFLLGVISAAAQQSGKQGPITPAAKPAGLTVDGIVEMAQAGISEDIVIATIRRDGRAFDLTSGDMVRLKKVNLSDNVLKIMLDPKIDLKTTQPAPAAVSTSQAAVPTRVIVETPALAGMPLANPSGATPSIGTTAEGDPNDPMTQHDSGIYLYTKDRGGKAEMIVLERAASQGLKTSTLGTAFTYGIKKAKTKAVIPGPRASVRTNDAAPIFYFYFDDKAAGLGKSYFGTANVTNPNQFALLKLDASKSNRQVVVAEANLFGGNVGANEKSMVGFKSERIRAGLYKVTIPSLTAGEYCFMSAGGVGNALTADLFDFSASVQ